MKDFMGHLARLGQLDHLYLDFSWCSNITDISLKELATVGLQSLVQVANFHLDFSQ